MNLKMLITSLIIILLIILIVLAIYWFFPVNIELEEVTQLYTDIELPGTWWSTVFSNEHSVQEDYNIKFPENDYDQNYLIVSGGREIEKLRYMRISKYLTPYIKKPYIGIVSFGKELNPNTIYVYKIDKIDVISPEAAGW